MTALPTRKLEAYRYADIDALSDVWDGLAQPERVEIAAQQSLQQIWLPTGEDVDVKRVEMTVGAGINSIMRAPDKSVLLITHYQRLLDYVTPDAVHVLSRGKIVRSGGPELAHELEREGYAEAAA